MDQGPDKLRRRVTQDIRLIQMQFVMTTAQINTLRTFYNTTIQGTGQVDWTDDLSGESCTYRFIGPPIYSFLEAGEWLVSINFEFYTTSDITASVIARVGDITATAGALGGPYKALVAATIAAATASGSGTKTGYYPPNRPYVVATVGAATASASAVNLQGGDALLLETGANNYILLETGENILLE
jgi:hypothetical protein